MDINQAKKKLRNMKNRIRGSLCDIIITIGILGLGFGLGLIKGVEVSEPYPLIRRRLEGIVSEVPQESDPIEYHKNLVDTINSYAADHLYSDILADKLICDLAVPRITSTPQVEKTVEQILQQRNFTKEASDYILENIKLRVLDPSITNYGGGLYCDDIKTAFTYSRNQESILHELVHGYWENLCEDEEFKRDFVKAVVRLANMDPDKHPLYENTINLAHSFVFGSYSNDMFKGVEDPNNLSDEDFKKMIRYPRGLTGPAIDAEEIYASIASFTMGNVVSGGRALPPFMWRYFSPLFNVSFPQYVSQISQYTQKKVEEIDGKIARLEREKRNQELQQRYELPESLENIALYADVYASSYEEGFPPELVVDGEVLNPLSAWTPVYSEEEPLSEFLIVDLGEKYKISKIDVFGWSRNPHDWYQKFRIELSYSGKFDGEQRTVVVENGWDDTRESHKPFNQFRDWEPAFFVCYPINRSGRYIRIISDEPQKWVRLEEIMVYGKTEIAKPTHGLVK